jgi:hypothetical protein
MSRKRSPLKPLTRADIILRNAVKKNKDAGIQPKHQIARRLFDDANEIVTSTPKDKKRCQKLNTQLYHRLKKPPTRIRMR